MSFPRGTLISIMREVSCGCSGLDPEPFWNSRGYATALVLELYADRTAHEFLVRILRDGQPLKLGLCDDKASCGVLVDGCGCINRQSNAGKAPKCRFNRQVSPKSNIK